MTVLVTGGAGFIGRWVVNKLILNGKDVIVIDNLSNGRDENLSEFKENPHFKELIINDITNQDVIEKLFSKYKFSSCIHLAAQI